MLIASSLLGGTPIVHHVGRLGRWPVGREAAADPMDMAWRLAGIVLGLEGGSPQAAAPQRDDAGLLRGLDR